MPLRGEYDFAVGNALLEAAAGENFDAYELAQGGLRRVFAR